MGLALDEGTAFSRAAVHGMEEKCAMGEAYNSGDEPGGSRFRSGLMMLMCL